MFFISASTHRLSAHSDTTSTIQHQQKAISSDIKIKTLPHQEFKIDSCLIINFFHDIVYELIMCRLMSFQKKNLELKYITAKTQLIIWVRKFGDIARHFM